MNLELKMINVEKTVQMVEQDTRVSQAVREALDLTINILEQIAGN